MYNLPQSVIDQTKTFAFFLGYPHSASGHSIVGTLMDSHPHIVISHEVDVFLKESFVHVCTHSHSYTQTHRHRHTRMYAHGTHTHSHTHTRTYADGTLRPTKQDIFNVVWKKPLSS